ncbi:MAG: hypothetical protein HY067_20925 [Betaproteobacteria bacterium]|nr:hypothetical protein [Betaproteobacteria bacterium]
MERCVNGIPRVLQPLRRGARRLFYDEDDAMATSGLFVRAPGANATAEARAMQLLLRVLRTAQRDEFLRYGYFTVDARGLGRFQILQRCVFNVLSVESGIAYCAVPDITVPIPDLMLAQKLILENDPARFFQVANQRQQYGDRSLGAML